MPALCELNKFIFGSAARHLLAKYRGVDVREFPRKCCSDHQEKRNMSEAFALNNMITTIGLGICGDEKGILQRVRENEFDRCLQFNSLIGHYETPNMHLVTTVKFSRGGVVHNCGLPQLTRLELMLLEKAALEIKKREIMAKQYIHYVEDPKCRPPLFKVKETEEKNILQQKFVR
ncbi:hypothetical protein NQ318_021780 [Aromia moschata]|uniref:Uncharacterized protein n=1 Tax=Aromia moschata TaxID=1265417 RepID=A0AAV8Z676_9CUCU|nr:hypothetical protein NQ318_021780 [Aromia moschata]